MTKRHIKYEKSLFSFLNKIVSKNNLLTEDKDVEISKYIVNKLGIKYLNISEKSMNILDLFNFQYSKCNDYYLIVEDSPNFKNIQKNDLILSGVIEINSMSSEFFAGEFEILRQDINGNFEIFKEFYQIDFNNRSEMMFKIGNYLCLNAQNFNNMMYFDRKRIESYLKKGINIILDFKNNGGGDIDNVICWLSVLGFSATYTIDKTANSINFRILNSIYNNKYFILCNSATASSAEVFINCLQRYGDCVVIGTETYGKNVACVSKCYYNTKLSIPIYNIKVDNIISKVDIDLYCDDIDNYSFDNVIALINDKE